MYKPRATGHTQIIPESLSHRKMSFATKVHISPSYSKMCPWGPTWYKLQKPNDVLLNDENTMLELPYDSAILLLGIHPDKAIFQKDTCTSMFTAAIFTMSKTWKQTKYSPTGEWIKKDVIQIYNEILLSHRKGQNNATCSNVGATSDYHTK